MKAVTDIQWVSGRLEFRWDWEELEAFMNREKLRAARRALSLVNRLRPGPTKQRHASRVWRNYNQLRRVVA